MKKTLALCAVCAAMTMSVHAEKVASNETVMTSLESSSASVSETQQQPMKIVTNCPNIRVNVTKCVANGKTVMLTFKMTNVSGNDAEDVLFWEEREVYDDQGNVYKVNRAGDLPIKYANLNFEGRGHYTLLADVPVTFTLKIEGVSTSAEYLARVTLPCEHDGLGMKIETPITLRNIPINRE